MNGGATVPMDLLVHLRRARDMADRHYAEAQDLLRATNLTVTEICHLVGFTSVGSFSSTPPATSTSTSSVSRHGRT